MDLQNVCRTCLRTPKKSKNLFEEASDLLKKIEIISCVVIEEKRGLSNNICEECFININNSYNFRQVIIHSDRDLKTRLETLIQTNHTFKPRRKCEEIEISPVENDAAQEIDIKVEEVTNSHCDTSVEFESETPIADSEMLLRALAVKQIYKCDQCNKLFHSKLKLHSHRRGEHAPPGVCNICGIIVRADNLSKHVRLHSESPIKCKECGKVFKNSESLRSHKFLHLNNVYTCEFCGKSFKMKGEHTRHLKLHTDPDARKATCSHCGKKVRDLRKHILTHTGQRPHICKYCDKGFTSTYALKVHTRRHTNERPYNCKYCGHSFPQKVSLTTHLKSKHSIV